MLAIRGIVRSLFQTGFLAALLLLPAGTWYWPRALQFLAVLLLCSLASVFILVRVAPASLAARIQRQTVKKQPAADRIVVFFLFVLFTAWVVFIPIDVFHLQLMPVVPPWLSVCGAAMALGGFGIMFTALRQNAYAAPIVGDQSERGQVLVDTGLYGRIRHPMYTGTLLFLAGIALWLQSFASVLTLSIGFAPIIARIFVEERALRETLPGYVEYMSRVRYRLVPYVW